MRPQDFSTKQEYYEWEYENAIKWTQHFDKHGKHSQAQGWREYAHKYKLLSEKTRG